MPLPSCPGRTHAMSASEESVIAESPIVGKPPTLFARLLEHVEHLDAQRPRVAQVELGHEIAAVRVDDHEGGVGILDPRRGSS